MPGRWVSEKATGLRAVLPFGGPLSVAVASMSNYDVSTAFMVTAAAAVMPEEPPGKECSVTGR
ncbi:hypothetical protein AYO44_05535 [Planctomycetaceae bacterium SCGC AG-212-F19]|nr:hypothetical protein AYO44_05535 [Planctomycetaceae bacterium SCGC AG-212-F19]